MRVKMYPHVSMFKSEESGIRRVIEAYFEHLPAFDIEMVSYNSDNFDLVAVHAGSFKNLDFDIPLVHHCHGLYWTAAYTAARWEWFVNRDVVEVSRSASEITVPSRWVQEVFQRDMHYTPTIVPHGIDASQWTPSKEHGRYVLWNKNRSSDVCDPEPVAQLALRRPDIDFISTFAPSESPSNVKTIGLLRHDEMKRTIEQAGVYLSSTKETFGIGVLEALASGVPVVGFRFGGNCDLIEHGVNGYLASPNDYDDLAEGLNYCIKYRRVLSANARESVKKWTWEAACERIAQVYRRAIYSHEIETRSPVTA